MSVKGAKPKRKMGNTSGGKVKGIRHYFKAKGRGMGPSLESGQLGEYCSGPNRAHCREPGLEVVFWLETSAQ